MKILKKNNKGFTLIEIVLVTGLIALFSIGIYGIYVKVSDSYTVTSEAREMNGILAAARSLIGGTNVTTLNATLLADARIIDSSRVIGLNYISGTGQQVSFEPIFVNTVSHIKVNYLKTTNIYCAKLATAFQVDVDLITVAGVVIKNTMPLGTNIPFDIGTLTSACASGGDSFTMSFNFRR